MITNKKTHRLNIIIYAVLILLTVAIPTSYAATDKARIIPLPKDISLPTLEGATSAPQEINHKRSIYFAHPDFYHMRSNRNLLILSHYQTYQQTTEYTCGPAAALTVLYYYGNHDFDEMDLTQGMKTQGIHIGTNTANIVAFFKNIGWQVETGLASKPMESYMAFKDFVIRNLRQQRPIMVENIDWGGHWRVIIGYDDMGTESFSDDVLIMADPYDTCDHLQDGYVINNGEKFFSMWFDHNVLPEDQRSQPWVVAYPAKQKK